MTPSGPASRTTARAAHRRATARAAVGAGAAVAAATRRRRRAAPGCGSRCCRGPDAGCRTRGARAPCASRRARERNQTTDWRAPCSWGCRRFRRSRWTRTAERPTCPPSTPCVPRTRLPSPRWHPWRRGRRAATTRCPVLAQPRVGARSATPLAAPASSPAAVQAPRPTTTTAAAPATAWPLRLAPAAASTAAPGMRSRLRCPAQPRTTAPQWTSARPPTVATASSSRR
mmetsp:Transcript_3918/g.11154  ORF Transcript_3918/g.11154 Transcript_3918/m.11154 type:complete len:229 (-) Transcript_3918:376-1062(-)